MHCFVMYTNGVEIGSFFGSDFKESQVCCKPLPAIGEINNGSGYNKAYHVLIPYSPVGLIYI